MFSTAKLIVGNPEDPRFLTTTFFALDEAKRKLAVIQIAVINQELIGSDLASCKKVSEDFPKILRDLNSIMDTAREGTRLIYKRKITKIGDVDDFAIEHLWPYLEKISVMGTHEDVAEMIRKCFPN